MAKKKKQGDGKKNDWDGGKIPNRNEEGVKWGGFDLRT